ncbi:MAG TPA: hypothetical protein EYQ83_11030, partial [Acidobacteria bacterium]|nr:hypothetical protein [Acidobacteriota bacterium]
MVGSISRWRCRTPCRSRSRIVSVCISGSIQRSAGVSRDTALGTGHRLPSPFLVPADLSRSPMTLNQPSTFSRHVSFRLALGMLTGLVGSVASAQSLASLVVRGSAALAVDPAASQTLTAGQTTDGLGLIAGRPTVRPTRTEAAPDIDGRLDDLAWQSAATLTEFTQQAPLEGAQATEATEVYITYDSEHVYFGFYLHYADPGVMRANRVDRDTSFQDDLITVYLDTFLAQQRAYDFDLNAFNVQGDGIVNASGNRRGGPIPVPDRSWDALFYSATEIVADGFTAEMAIPLKSLRYPQRAAGERHRWGLQIIREIKGKNEENAVWAPMSRDVAGFHRQMGLMEGMTDFSTSRNLEFLPTFTAIKFGSLDTSTGGFVSQDTDPQAGLNIKYGLTSNLTVDVTFNPDFSQIESDRPQIEVNQRFPLFFSELRPFFVEGAEIFDFPGPVTFVHTRTIVDPTWGAKLTGKAGRFSVGVLTAEDEAPGNLDDISDP